MTGQKKPPTLTTVLPHVNDSFSVVRLEHRRQSFTNATRACFARY